MRSVLLGLLLISLLIPVGVVRADTAPLLNLYLGYQMTDDSIRELAKWDIVVLDMDQPYQFPQLVKKIKEINPSVKLLAYVSVGEIAENRWLYGDGSVSKVLVQQIPEAFFLKRPGGPRVSWWPGASLLNATDVAPLVNGKRWNTVIGPYIRDTLLANKIWDGVFLDTCYDEVTSKFGVGLDMDGDGRADDSRKVDNAYDKGMRTLVRNVKQAVGKEKMVMVNSSIGYADEVNGVLFEGFPKYGWHIPFKQMQDVMAINHKPMISAFNTNTSDREERENYRLMRYGFASSLIAGVYYSFDAGSANHHRTWWYDEYDALIGTPSKLATQTKGGWIREYTKGIALVNPTNKPITFELNGQYEKISGKQDPRTNTGELVRSVTVPAEDGLILYKRGRDGLDINDAILVNGQFYQLQNSKGEKVRNGFFAQDKRVPTGATYSITDLDRDGKRDLVFASKGRVTVQYGDGSKRQVDPYPKFYGDIDFAIGQTDHDSELEIVTVPLKDSASRIRVFQHDLKSGAEWLAYRQEFRGGATVSLGDWDGDGLREIVVAAGVGGGPHIRSYKTDGKDWRGSFFAYSADQQGGAAIALADTDGDGRAELLAGSGKGMTPQVRLYDADQRLIRQWAIGTGINQQLLRVKSADIDGDGVSEILIPSSAF